MRRATTALVAVCLVSSGAFSAFAVANKKPGPLYFANEATMWTQNTQRFLGDRRAQNYNFEAGILGAARRPVQRYPSHYLTAGIDVRREAQVLIDGTLHMRPDPPYDHWGDVGDPRLMPDWDHDGAFGDSGGTSIGGTGDFDADTDEVLDTAYFRIPCYTAKDKWLIHHRYASGSCDVADAGSQPYKIGVATETKIIDARGLLLDATVWVPAAAFGGTGCPLYGTAAYASRASWTDCVAPSNLAGRFPGVVFANGLASRQEHYAWIAMRLVDEGYVVLTYDPAGQGQSEGTFGDTLGLTDEERADPQFAGAIRDLQDAVRWFVGQSITKTRSRLPRLTPRLNPASNAPNPALSVVDTTHVAIGGNSMGAISTLGYLDYLGSPGGLGADGRPLPRVLAALSLSGARATHAVVPIQFQTSDGDGSPLLLLPKVAGVNLGFNGQGIGYELIKERYDQLRATREAGPLSLIVLEGGVHTDHVNVPLVTRTNWANALAADYAAAWINCYVKGDAAACAAAIAPRPHLSHAYASEQDPDGPAGPSASRCITVPDGATLNETPQDFLAAETGSPRYDCKP
jgi:X-Pro dipeptidyl-peptidase-like protein